MLTSLAIQNYALIDSLTIRFDNGFSVITGETGAGKSIILGALSLILGQRAETRYIKQDEAKCIVEGVFDISKYDLKDFFEQHDWVYDGDECILRREIWANGKSRAFVNDSPVYLNDLKELGERLIDIHSQHQNLSLNDNLYQLNVVDLIAGTAKEKSAFSVAFFRYRTLEKNLSMLREQSRTNKEEEDYLRFQHAGLSEADLEEEEQERLEAELEAITHSEEIKSGLFSATSLLSGDDSNVESLLRSVLESLRSVERVFPDAAALAGRVESAYIDLKDVRAEAEGLFEAVDFDPERQQVVEDRLSLIYDLEKKHSLATVGELIELRENIRRKLENIDSLDEQITALENDVAAARHTMLDTAAALSKKRQAAAPAIEKQLIERLSYLGMPNARFKCAFTARETPDATGSDYIQFLFSANKNTALQPVSQIASGGEISRVMLAVKSMVAGATALPTIIFDEIDTGTSGEIAEKMGLIMHEMSRRMQVVAITHLPQIASKGDAHFVVYKEESGDSVMTQMKRLSHSERIEEIARMLSGADITAQAIENAKVMLNMN
ncbi:MAG TPA: DNA repair protein RecN [Porphyromonadaceae bacterium]|nr:DNA repair protein RecN [Porphyromonadaceae bacterium]